MTTSPSRNDLATTFVHPHKTDVPVKIVNVSTAPTVGVIQEMKGLQTEEICVTVDARSIPYRPQAIAGHITARKKIL
jgi:hypothetical protein